ncbi:L-2-hydroxyglutarate oxidase [Herbaspirillum sp.]|uniref:L-2-hydroxyglutarate oxidase n=1 Tax=Herbaspirillum sp. TaxID=1890675 RepID=UPI001B18180F|nr:L-2-hydroxyglutarate oxidase [Herbaspirillum sp.]MBO9536974.1 L-2-hydroxyglutarate oxidase [Herbaspirillum sp.]
MNKRADFLIIGAGIVGLTIGRELKLRFPRQSVLVLEKERAPGLHSSGRNSGVLHSGIYYPPGSLKAQVCRQGAIEMAAYHEEHGLPLRRLGKILVAGNEFDAPQLDLLADRARQHGIPIETLDAAQLAELEPETRSVNGRALLVPSTSVGSPGAVMQTLLEEVRKLGLELALDSSIVAVDTKNGTATTDKGDVIGFGHAINTAGLHADSVAHLFGAGKRYTLLPFKGLYWKLDPAAGFKINRLIYPVPDLRVPFLGIHTTTTTDGTTYLGPTAVPAFGRENYHGLEGVSLPELSRITGLLVRQFSAGRDGFRRLAMQEGRRYFKKWFAEAASAILPRLRPEHLLPTDKVGIRAQMLDTETGKLVNDFLVESGERSTHVLNAISPAWTSSFPFARHVCDNFIERN